MRPVLLAVAVAACATPRGATRGADGPVTLDPLEPVAAYLEPSPAPKTGAAEAGRVRVEILEIAVSPMRPDGGQWDGGALPDDAAQARLTEALASPDAARRVPRLLADLGGRASAPDLAGEIAAAGERVALGLTPDVLVRGGAALPALALTRDATVTIRVVDRDDHAEQPVGEVILERDQLQDALHAGGPAVLDLRGVGSGGILFITLRVTAA